MARLITLVAVVASLVAFIAEETGSNGTWIGPLNRASYVLVVLAIVAALLSERRASLLVVWAQVAATAAALVFAVVALFKYYDNNASPFDAAIAIAYTWLGEASVLSLSVLAFGLTLARKRNPMAVVALAAAVAAAVGCAIYAITVNGGLASYMWWEIAGIGAFLAAAAAAGLERGGGDALRAPVPSSAGGAPGSDPGVE
jgi:hypothetical protein